MTDQYVELQRVFNEAYETPDGPIQVEMFDQAVRIADSLGDLDLQFNLRLALISSSFKGGAGDKLLSALAWCLAVLDENPDRFDDGQVVWKCKHALSYVTGFHNVSRQQILDLSRDVESRFRKSGASLRGFYTFACSNELAMGYPETAREYYEKFRVAPHDMFSEPEDWEVYFDTKFLLEFEGEEAAIERARSLFDFESIKSEVAPWALLLLFDAIVKRPEMLPNAAIGQRKSYLMVKGNPKFLSHYGAHISFLGVTKNYSKAVEIFESSAPWLIDRFVLPASRLAFLRNGWFLFDLMSEQGLGNTKVRMPKDFSESEIVSIDAHSLSKILEQECLPLIESFNQRNLNKHVTETTEKIFAMKKHLIDFPI